MIPLPDAINPIYDFVQIASTVPPTSFTAKGKRYFSWSRIQSRTHKASTVNLSLVSLIWKHSSVFHGLDKFSII